MVSKTRQAQALTGMLLLVVAVALTGSPIPIEIHEECLDNINNDGGGPIFADGIDLNGGLGGNPVNYGAPDGPDMNCLDYPWADGNGESPTPYEDRYQGAKYASTTFEVWNEYNNGCGVVELGGLSPPTEDGSNIQYEAQCITPP